MQHQCLCGDFTTTHQFHLQEIWGLLLTSVGTHMVHILTCRQHTNTIKVNTFNKIHLKQKNLCWHPVSYVESSHLLNTLKAGSLKNLQVTILHLGSKLTVRFCPHIFTQKGKADGDKEAMFPALCIYFL